MNARTRHKLTFVTVLDSKGSLRGFVVSHIAQSFTFASGLILDDHAIFNITILLKIDNKNSQNTGRLGFREVRGKQKCEENSGRHKSLNKIM